MVTTVTRELRTYIVRCCIYLTTYDWIKSLKQITIEGRAIYGNLEIKIELCLTNFLRSSKAKDVMGNIQN
jgi:hypothetical protein